MKLYKKLSFIIVIVLTSLLTTSCISSGRIFIEKEIGFVTKKQKNIKIVSIAPSFYLINQKKDDKAYKTLSKGTRKLEDFEKLLKENAKMNKIDLQVVSSDHLGSNDVDYFNTLKPLRDQIILSNIYQNPEVTSKSFKKGFSKVPIGTFAKTPQISADFNALVEKYKTKYFAVNAVFAVEGKLKASNFLSFLIIPPMAFHTNAATYYYTIIVDVEKSEIVYRELRYIDEKSFNSNLDGIIYDSYKIIKNIK